MKFSLVSVVSLLAFTVAGVALPDAENDLHLIERAPEAIPEPGYDAPKCYPKTVTVTDYKTKHDWKTKTVTDTETVTKKYWKTQIVTAPGKTYWKTKTETVTDTVTKKYWKTITVTAPGKTYWKTKTETVTKPYWKTKTVTEYKNKCKGKDYDSHY